MNWQVLWKDARRAASAGHQDIAAELFTRCLCEAQRQLSSEDPAFSAILKERNEFFRNYDRDNRTLSKVNDLSEHHSPSLEEKQPETLQDHHTSDSTLLRLCSSCGVSSLQCNCNFRSEQETKRSENFEPGDFITSRYQVIKILGRGGMATVYLVRNSADELLAMKILNDEFGQDSEATERFEREAQSIRKLHHTNIVSVSDFGKMSNGRSYFIMEFVQGESLLSVIEREGHLTIQRTCKVFLQICDGMAHAHKVGIVHRDLKPSNILLTKVEQVKIVDFGIAKITQTLPEFDSRLTQEGQIFGSPAYMSPEQCLGDQIDHRSDIYSIGCMFYESLCGVPPFSAEHMLALVLKHVQEEPPTTIPSREKIPPRLENIVLKALRKQPEARYQSMVQMESELLDFVVANGIALERC